ncbi:hypothetical protein OUZ56_025451 [Daphnia magna]|uniref:Uncharacterized protein n=2 Tax=Daphnia magna TaxID=35525 RepID=A0ABQ9ZJW8_9CRUS|nr:hypothetical protein OUZ56_025451 [Daphnia magna]
MPHRLIVTPITYSRPQANHHPTGHRLSTFLAKPLSVPSPSSANYIRTTSRYESVMHRSNLMNNCSPTRKQPCNSETNLPPVIIKLADDTYNLLWHEIWLSFVNNCISENGGRPSPPTLVGKTKTVPAYSSLPYCVAKNENNCTRYLVAIETYKQQLEELEINKNQQIQILETQNGELQDTIKNLEKEIEGMKNQEKEIQIQQPTNIIPESNNNEEDSTSYNNVSEDESDVTLQNYELTKYPTTQPFTIPLRVKQQLEQKVNEIVAEDWTIDTIKNSHYTKYKFTTHKRSGKGGKPGAIQREIMNPTYVEEITKYLIHAWRNLKGSTPKIRVETSAL